jgi:K+-sensing histidine kinase KdpD
MGLSICRSIIEAHDGEVGASNNPDFGATFHFTLPAANVAIGSPVSPDNCAYRAPLNRDDI